MPAAGLAPTAFQFASFPVRRALATFTWHQGRLPPHFSASPPPPQLSSSPVFQFAVRFSLSTWRPGPAAAAGVRARHHPLARCNERQPRSAQTTGRLHRSCAARRRPLRVQPRPFVHPLGLKRATTSMSDLRTIRSGSARRLWMLAFASLSAASTMARPWACFTNALRAEA